MPVMWGCGDLQDLGRYCLLKAMAVQALQQPLHFSQSNDTILLLLPTAFILRPDHSTYQHVLYQAVVAVTLHAYQA